jgi:hypothetical protein
MADTIFYYNNGDPTSSSNTIITQSSYNRALSLNSVTIGDSVTSIGAGAFTSSTIDNITISSSVTFIDANAFSNCFNLKNVIINGNNLFLINSYAFGGCIALENINLPNSVRIISSRAFSDCYQLTSFNISSNVIFIGERVFERNKKIINFNVDPNNPNYSSDADGVLFNKNKTSLINYPLGNTRTSYIIPSSVASIQISAFFDAQYITKIIIPDNVTSMGNNVFLNCLYLTDVNIGKGITTIPYRAFRFCNSLSNVIIEKNVRNIADEAFQGNEIFPTSFKCYFKGDAPTLEGINVFNSTYSTIYRYSIRSGWPSTLGGRPVVTIGSSAHQGLQAFGFPNIDSGKVSIKKTNFGRGKISLYKTPPKFLYFGVPLLVSNLPSDPNPSCNFSIFNTTWIYLGSPSFRYRSIDSFSYFITTPLTPEAYGGNGSYQIRDSDDVYFTNNYNNTDKFPSDNWQLAYYLINNCSQYTTAPIFVLPNPNAVILYESGTGNPLTYSGDGLSTSHFVGGLSGGGQDGGSWTVTFKIKTAGTLYYSFNLESEQGYDYASSRIVDGTIIFPEQSGYVQSNGNIPVAIDEIITITYYKDESVSAGFDGIQFDFYIV